VATFYTDDRTRPYWRDKKYADDYKWLEKQKAIRGKEISLGSMTKDEQLLLIATGSDAEPGERWLFDRRSRKLTFQYGSTRRCRGSTSPR